MSGCIELPDSERAPLKLLLKILQLKQVTLGELHDEMIVHAVLL